MKYLIDTDVLLDVVLKREPHFGESRQVLDHAQDHPRIAAVAWHSFSTIAYFVPGEVREITRHLLSFTVLPAVDATDLAKAAQFPMKDFEDAMQAACALSFGAQAILSRNKADYRGSPVPCLTPAEFCRRLRAK